MKKLLCLFSVALTLCSGFVVPSLEQSTIDKGSRIRCGGYLTIKNSSSFYGAKVQQIKVTGDDLNVSYSIPLNTTTFSVPDILHTGESYKLEFRINKIDDPFNDTDNWIMEIRRPDGILVREVDFDTTSLFTTVTIWYFHPDCFTYEVRIRKSSGGL